MGRIYYIMGKSASGKDTIYKELLKIHPDFDRIILYTTRPIREGERDGQEYYFITREQMNHMRQKGQLIEERTYQTVEGPWTYATAADSQLEERNSDALMIGTLESYLKLRARIAEHRLVPIYIELEDGVRLQRALTREKQQMVPHYAEMCRRYLADEEDFCEDNLKAAGILKRYCNENLKSCLEEIVGDIT